MKKLLSVLAITLMLVGVSGCMDDPDGSKQNTSKRMTNT
jgi:PBP1b-binding outer membrane lipoprotein LpoB